MHRALSSVFVMLLMSGICVRAQGILLDTLGLDRAGISSPADLLKAKMPGVLVSGYNGNVNESLNVSIRGLNSLRSDNQPLWIVDGAMLADPSLDSRDPFWQYGMGPLERLNPYAFLNKYDIESIEVIKDASSAALYGSVGAGGVIIVKTRLADKRERQIRWNSDLSYNGNFSHQHYLSLGGARNKAAYNISGWWSNVHGSVPRNSNEYGGLKINFASRANEKIQVGLNGILSIGTMSSPLAAVAYGEPSLTLAMRDEKLSEGCGVDDWLADYDDDSKEYRAVSSAFLDIAVLPVLKWKTSVGVDFRNTDRKVWYGTRTLFGKQNNAAAAILNTMSLNYNVRTTFEYGQFINVNHRIKAVLGAESYGSKDNRNTMNGTDFFTERLRADGLSLMKSTPLNRKIVYDFIRCGAFATIGYDYRNVVGASVSTRADMALKYDDVPVVYPAAEVYWKIRPYLVLEGGWGMTGKESYVPYEYTSDYLDSYPEKTLAEAVYVDGLNRIKSMEWHLGAKGSFFGGRLDAGITYYDRNVNDCYRMFDFSSLTPAGYLTYGARQEIFSVSEMISGRGIELAADARVMSTKDFSWTLGMNATYTRLDADGYAGKVRVYEKGAGPVSGSQNAGHESLGFTTFKRAARCSVTSKVAGAVEGFDMVSVGSAIPEWYGAIYSTLGWRDFHFEICFNAVGGNHIVNLNAMAMDKAGYLTSDYVEKGDYFRLSRLSLSYDIPVKVKAIRSLSVNLSGLNLFTLTGYSGYNPDVDSYGTSTRFKGYDYGSYPLRASFVLGIRADFQ